MKIYHADPDTGEFTAEGLADESPLEPGKFLIPAHATKNAPPKSVQKGHVVIFDGESWIAEIDNRGETYWTPEGELITITEIGVEIPGDALTEKPDLRTLDEAKAEGIARVVASHSEFLSSLTGNATIEERDTWTTKAVAAEAYQADTATDFQKAMIETEADLAGETPSELVATILAKHTAYHSLIGLATGMKRKTEAEIEAATSNEEVETILTAARSQAETKAADWLATLAA